MTGFGDAWLCESGSDGATISNATLLADTFTRDFLRCPQHQHKSSIPAMTTQAPPTTIPIRMFASTMVATGVADLRQVEGFFPLRHKPTSFVALFFLAVVC
jgi:hypothetical protein